MEFDVNGGEKVRIETSGQVTLGGSTTAFNTNPNVEGLQLHYETDSGIATIAAQHDDGFGNLIFQTSPAGGGPSETSFTVNAHQNIVMAQGHGIDFANNAHASGMSSELFDDYEEGTFTATIIGSTSSPSSGQTTTGNYTKIGRQVFADALFGNVDTTGAANIAPFWASGTVVNFYQALHGTNIWVALEHNAGVASANLYISLTYITST
mgnify:CR=1 FL=1